MTPVRLIWHVAIRQLFARRRQTLTVIGGVVLAITILLASMALFGGLLASFTSKVIDATPHLTMSAENLAGSSRDLLIGDTRESPVIVQLDKNSEHEDRVRIRNVFATMKMIGHNLGQYIRVASPYLSTQALAAYGTNEVTLPISGVIPSNEAKLSGLTRYLLSGSVERLEATHNGIFLGIKAAKDLGVRYGERIQLVSLKGTVLTAQVCGIYELGFDATDRLGLVNLRFAQSLEQALPDEATGISFHLYDVTKARFVADRIQMLTGKKTDTWEELNAGFIAIFSFLRNLFFVVTGFVIVICGFGVANILITTVLEKQRDIAVMKSMGFSRGDLNLMYLMQALAVAVIGSLTGAVTGAVVIYLLGKIPFIDPNNSVAPFKSDTMPVVWNIWYFVIAIVSTSLVSLLAGVAPARSAARVVPVEILRGER